MNLKRTLILLGVVVAALVAVWMLWPAGGAEPGAVNTAETLERGRQAGAEPSARPTPRADPVLAAETPAPRGTLTIRGVVLEDGKPAAGAVVIATGAASEETLSDMPCACDNHCGRKLLECGCPEAARQMTELVGVRQGETQPLARATAGADGTFEVTGLAEGTVGLWAHRAGASAFLKAVAVGSDAQKLELQPGMKIDGKAEDDGEKPVAGALVTAIFVEHSRFFETTTGPDGRFVFAALPRGDYSVVASAEGLLPDTAKVDGDLGRTVNLTLSVPRTVRGLVTREGQPVAGAEVKLDGQHRKAKVKTDAAGAFAQPGLRPGRYEVTATSGRESAAASVSVPVGKDPEAVTLELTVAAEVVGTVKDASGQPVAGARVSVGADRRWVSAESEKDGTFRVFPVVPGVDKLDVRAKGFLTRTDEVEVGVAERRAVEVRLEAAARIAGTVVDEEGQPVAKVNVFASSAAGKDDRDERPEAATTDQRGAFELSMAPGAWKLRFDSDEHQQEELTAAAPASGLKVTLRRGLEITGTVKDADGRGVGDVQVRAFSKATEGSRGVTSRPDGTFKIGGLVAGDYKLSAWDYSDSGSGRRTDADVQLAAGKPAVAQLVFPRALDIVGVVVDKAGKPVEKAHVNAIPDRKGDDDARATENMVRAGFAYAVTDAQGRFKLHVAEARRYRLSATGKSGSTPNEPGIFAEPGGPEVTLTLGGGMLRGRVLGDGGKPLTEFSVNLEPFSSPDGTYAARIWRGGEREVRYDAEGFATAVRKLELTEGQDFDAPDVQMERGRALSGRVVDAVSGEPVVDALVDVGDLRQLDMDPQLIRLSEPAGAVRTRGDGRFRLPNIRAETMALFAVRRDYVMASRRLEPGEDQVVLKMVRGATVRVRVTGLDAQSATYASAAATRELAPGRLQTVTASEEKRGNYRIEGLAAGTWTVSALGFNDAGSAPIDPVKVTVAAGSTTDVELKVRTQGATVVVRRAVVSKELVALLLPGSVQFPKNPRALQGQNLRFATAVEGGMQFKFVAPGLYTVFVVDSSNRTQPAAARTEVTVPAAGTIEVDASGPMQPVAADLGMGDDD